MYIRLDTITGIYRQTDLIGKTILQFACIGESPEYITFEGRTSGGDKSSRTLSLCLHLYLSFSRGLSPGIRSYEYLDYPPSAGDNRWRISGVPPFPHNTTSSASEIPTASH